MEMEKITSWDNPIMQYCVKQLRKVPKFNHIPEIAHVDEEGGKQDYASRLVKVLFSKPDKTGDVEALDKAIKYINSLSTFERIEFVSYMRMYANSGRKSMNAKTLFIGANGEEVVDSATTQKQIAEVESLECTFEHEGEKATWKDLDNPDEPRSLFQAILRDRKRRVDEHNIMADRPSFAVITVMDKKAVRLEYYEGHDALQLVYDLRAKELHGKKLPNYMDADPQAYDPVKFLKDTFGIPEELSKPILEEAHKNE